MNPCEVRLKQTLENLENSENPKFLFQVEGTFGGVPDMGMGFQTWGWGSSQRWGSRYGDGVPVRDGVPDKDGVPDIGMGFQTRGVVPNMRMGFLTWGWGFLTWEWGSRQGWGS